MKKSYCSVRSFLRITYVVLLSLTSLPLFTFAAVKPAGVIITGKVTDEKGSALIGTTIVVEGTQKSTSADSDGNYRIDVPEGKRVLVFSCIGYITRKVSLGSGAVLNVKMQPDEKNLGEVVVVGYGVQKKVTVTGAVASIGTKDLLQSPVANVSNMLVGRLPGLIAVQRSGEPGQDGSSLKIRGIGTLDAGSGSDPLIMVDGIERSNINQIDPNEIETINILKDASSTAVYGVRGANGVILITTRRGKMGPPKLSLTSNLGRQSPTQLPKMVSSYEYATLKNEALKNDGKEPYFTEEDLELFKSGKDPVFHPSIDWFDMMLKPYSLQSQHNLNISGGTSLARYFISGGYFEQNGAYRYADYNPEFSANPKYKRYNFRSNFDFDVTPLFTVKVNLGGQVENQNYPAKSAGDIFFDVLSANPFSSPGIVDGKLVTISGAVNGRNPLLTMLNAGYQQLFKSNVNSSVILNHKLDFITAGLSARGTIAYDSWYSHSIRRSKNNVTYLAVKDPANAGNILYVPQGEETTLGFSEGYDKRRKIYGELAVDYNRSFGSHNVTGLLLYNQSKAYAPTLTYKVPNAYLGMAARVTYNFKSRYLVEFNMGYNGSENFPEGKRFGWFPAYSLGWVASDEPFFPKNKYLTFLKVRGSYGEVGNDKLSDIFNGGSRFLYLPSSFAYGGGYNFGEVGSSYQWYGGSYEGKLGNPDITWERAKKSNIGLEMKLLNNRLSFTGDYFQEKRNNILAMRGAVPGIVGVSDLPAYNLGRVSNKGFELDAGYNDYAGKVNYWVKANYSFARNKIEFKDEAPRVYAYQNETGNPVGQYFGLVAEGLFNSWDEINDTKRPQSSYAPGTNGRDALQPGDIRYKDVNGDGVINNDDQMPIGYSQLPQIIYGFSFGAAYKGFDCSVLFQGAGKASVYLEQMAAWPFDTDWRNAMSVHMERWNEERYKAGENITFPRLSQSPAGNNYQRSSYWLKDASYLRLKNVEVGYTFTDGILKRAKIGSVRVYANGMNLVTWSSLKTYDPEAPDGRGQFYPQQKVYNVGLNLQF
ncbi:TonB-linked SusC/RagA family outer membrane protein [Chitinophaga sp. W2I13]|uniref:SusC/RagA family TonB-linked outer membrane protein n=1 Tax=Chitinophaga sp. W2I13 TaxID=3373923 RepID=UPI003D21C423